MSKKELMMIKGGSSFSASFLNAISRAVETFYNLGRSLGSSIKMLVSGKRC